MIKWISVDESLPELGDDVICLDSDGDMYCCDYRTGGFRCAVNCCASYGCTDVFVMSPAWWLHQSVLGKP